MWQRESIVREMAATLWQRVGGAGSLPPAAVQAAAELAELYEEVNGRGVVALQREIPRGVSLMDVAMGEVDAPQIVAPEFHASMENGYLSWEGASEPRRNPTTGAARGLEVLLIEDEIDPKRATDRLIRKLYPSARVIVADNADAAIADLQTHDFKLIVSDYLLLGAGTGGDVLAWVRSHRPDLVSKFVFVSDAPEVERLHDRWIRKRGAKAQDLRDEIWPEEGAPPTPSARALPPRSAAILTGDDAALARMVNDAAHRVGPDGRYGARNVFIAALWEDLEPQLGATLEQFKRRLVALNRQLLITMARADMVDAMDPDLVARSEIESMGSHFHFVVDRTARDPWEQNPAPAAGARWRRSDVQSLLFDRSRYTPAQAKDWASRHGFVSHTVDTTEWLHHLRQFDAGGRPCRTIAFGHGIEAVVCSGR